MQKCNKHENQQTTKKVQLYNYSKHKRPKQVINQPMKQAIKKTSKT